MGLLIILLPGSFQGRRLLWAIDLRLTHWTVSRLHFPLGRSSSPGSWAAAKASSRESPWNSLLMFMQWPVWSSIQYSYCSVFRECQEWPMLKCVQDLDGDSSLPTTVFSFGEPSATPGDRGWGWNTRNRCWDAESRSEVDCLEEPCGPRLLSKDHSFPTLQLTYSERGKLSGGKLCGGFLLFVFVMLEVKQSLVHTWEVLYHWATPPGPRFVNFNNTWGCGNYRSPGSEHCHGCSPPQLSWSCFF